MRVSVEASLAVGIACLMLRFAPLSAQERRDVCLGLGWAWLGSTAGTLMLMRARAFWNAFGAGIFLRGAILAALMVYARRNVEVSQAALLGAYALGVAGLLLVEYRYLVRG